jgi:hypothetical protein
MIDGDLGSATRRRRTFAMLGLAAAVLAAAGCTPDKAATPAAITSVAAPAYFGPDGFGKLKVSMTEDAAVATGDLGAAPIAVVTGCHDYSYAGGPSPDPKRMAADAKLEKDYEKANKAADKAPTGTSAADSAKAAKLMADAAKAAADSTERIAQRTEEFAKAGGASFGQGRMRLLYAPPKAATAEGIAVGSTEAELKSAYAAKGLTAAESVGRWEMPVSGQAGWKFTVDVAAGKVAALLLINSTVACK